MCYAGFVINKAPSETMSAPLSGRQAEARRNDGLILEAAREVFVEDPDAPISALAEEDDPWAAFAAFMWRIVDADTHSLTLRLAGTFTPTEELYRDSRKAQELNLRLFERTKTAGAIRHDVEVDDLSLLFEQVAAVRMGDEERTRQLRRRYLALLLDALHVPSESPLPGPPPSWEEITRRWENQPSPRFHEARGKSSPLGRKQ